MAAAGQRAKARGRSASGISRGRTLGSAVSSSECPSPLSGREGHWPRGRFGPGQACPDLESEQVEPSRFQVAVAGAKPWIARGVSEPGAFIGSALAVLDGEHTPGFLRPRLTLT